MKTEQEYKKISINDLQAMLKNYDPLAPFPQCVDDWKELCVAMYYKLPDIIEELRALRAAVK